MPGVQPPTMQKIKCKQLNKQGISQLLLEVFCLHGYAVPFFQKSRFKIGFKHGIIKYTKKNENG